MIRKKINRNGVTKYEARVKVQGQTLYQRFGSFREAEKWINEVRHKRTFSTPICHGAITVQMLFDKHLEISISKGNVPSTIKRDKLTFKNHILPFYEKHDLKEVSLEEHAKLISIIQKKGLKPATVNRVRSLMNRMFEIAVRKKSYGGMFLSNPFTGVDRMREDRSVVAYWNQESIERFLESEKNSHYYSLWILMLNTGMRIGEAVALCGEQVDKSAHVINVDRIFDTAINDVRFTTKGRKIRRIGINEPLRNVLYPMIKSGPFFTKPDGSKLTSFYVSKKILPRACKKADVKNIGCHGFRHTYGSHYMMNNGSLWDLQKILGHSSLKVTEEHYAHFSPEHIVKRASVVSIGSNVMSVNFIRGVA